MLIDNDLKLDFQDVLIRPKRSTLESRSQVSLERSFKTSHGVSFSGIPIIAANMATGTFKMLDVFSKEKMFVAIAKHFNNEWQDHISQNERDYGLYTIGMNDNELAKLLLFADHVNTFFGYNDYSSSGIKICIDIANGYTQRFASFVEKVRMNFHENVIVAGNVATPEMVQELVIAGADFIKIGVGPGCFVPGTKIETKSGTKNVEDVIVGDEVISHIGEYKKVIDTLKYDEKEKIISVNGIKSTSHHEYYVLEKQYRNIITEENIHQYAKWISADKLDKNIHLLIRRKIMENLLEKFSINGKEPDQIEITHVWKSEADTGLINGDQIKTYMCSKYRVYCENKWWDIPVTLGTSSKNFLNEVRNLKIPKKEYGKNPD